jgi:hypothetical protein
MVGATYEQDTAMAIPTSIWKMEMAIKELPWYAFIRRWQMQGELAEFRYLGGKLGFIRAMKELEDMGLVKRVQ